MRKRIKKESLISNIEDTSSNEVDLLFFIIKDHMIEKIKIFGSNPYFKKSMKSMMKKNPSLLINICSYLDENTLQYLTDLVSYSTIEETQNYSSKFFDPMELIWTLNCESNLFRLNTLCEYPNTLLDVLSAFNVQDSTFILDSISDYRLHSLMSKSDGLKELVIKRFELMDTKPDMEFDIEQKVHEHISKMFGHYIAKFPELGDLYLRLENRNEFEKYLFKCFSLEKIVPVLNAPGYIEREWSSFLFDDLNVESEEKAEILSSLSREKRSRISQSINFEIGIFLKLKRL